MNQRHRQTGCMLTSLALAASMAGCAGEVEPPVSSQVSVPVSTASSQPAVEGYFYRFDLERFTQKIWEGNTVYFDTLCFMEQEDGSVASGTLLYTPDKVLSVRSHDLKTIYEEGRDYTLQGNRLVRTENSRIPVFPLDQYREPVNAGNAWLRISGTDYALQVNGAGRLLYQVAVCYTHSEEWAGAKPASQTAFLPRTAAKLANKERLKLVFYGDSITVGMEASGQNETLLNPDTLEEIEMISGRSPYTPAWPEMVTNKLQSVYGYSAIFRANRAIGGTTSVWGKQYADTLVNPEKPDLVVIAFGMNEVATSGAAFRANVEAIMDTIHSQNPEAEFLLVSSMLPNEDAEVFSHHRLQEQEEALYAIQRERTDLAVGVAPVNSVFLSMQERGKRHTDYSGNNVNHPNDFAVTVYAQVLLQALGC